MLRTQRFLATGCSLLFQFMPVAVLAVWSVDCLAAPSVSGISGTITEGSQITISGSGFGTGGDSPLLWDNFENGTDGALMNASPQAGTWVPGSNLVSYYSTAYSYSGTKSLFSPRHVGTTWGGFSVNFGPSTKIFQSFRYMFRDDGSATNSGGGYKLLLLFGNSGYGEYGPSYALQGAGGWWKSQMSTSTATNEYPRDLVKPYPLQGVWHRIELQGKQSSGGTAADGSVEMWIDGVKNYDHHGITRDNAAYSWNSTTFFGGTTNLLSAAETYVDDAYLNDSWARAIVSDSPTFAGVIKSEIQRPMSWADGSVTVKLNKGAFADFSTLYLYVIDNDGNANASGFKLNGVPVVAPKPPSSVAIQ